MRTKIYYAGDKSSIQEIATVIAQEFKLPAEQLQPAYMPEGLALAFIGTEDHGGKPHKIAIEFANTLDAKRMEAVALFCTSPKKSGDCLKELRKVLEGRGIKVLEQELICNGKGGLFGGGKNPTDEDVQAAKAFAKVNMDKTINHTL